MKEKGIGKREYTEAFKVEAVRLVESFGVNEAARRLGAPTATIGNWARRARKEGSIVPAVMTGVTKRPVSELEVENSRLRRELAEAKLDVEILKKPR